MAGLMDCWIGVHESMANIAQSSIFCISSNTFQLLIKQVAELTMKFILYKIFDNYYQLNNTDT